MVEHIRCNQRQAVMRHHPAPDMGGDERIVLDDDDVRLHCTDPTPSQQDYMVESGPHTCRWKSRADSTNLCSRFQSPFYGIASPLWLASRAANVGLV